MNRMIFGGSLVCVLFLIFGSIFLHGTLVMELASTSLIYNIIRAVLVVALIVVLCTTPPRAPAARLGVGTVALGILAWGLVMSFSNGMHLLDALLFIQIGAALGIEALEFSEEELLGQAELILHPEEKVPRQPILRPILASMVASMYAFAGRLRHEKWLVDAHLRPSH